MASGKGARKQEILQTLAQMLESQLDGRITTAALAAQLGLSEAALYRHFPSKTRMFEGLIDFIEETIFARVTSIAGEAQDAPMRCERILTLLLTFAERNPGITRLLNGDALTGEPPRLHERIAQLFDRLESQLKQIIREAEVRDGLLLNADVGATANLMLAAAEGRIGQFVRSRFRRPPTEKWREQWVLLNSAMFG